MTCPDYGSISAVSEQLLTWIQIRNLTGVIVHVLSDRQGAW